MVVPTADGAKMANKPAERPPQPPAQISRLASPDGPDEPMPWQRRRSARVSAAQPPSPGPPEPELTVCDIIGDWGLYQWSLCLFATVYSGLAGITVMFGPMLTPDMAHVCRPADGAGGPLVGSPWMPSDKIDVNLTGQSTAGDEIPPDRHECFIGAPALSPAPDGDQTVIVDDDQQLVAIKCTSFQYNDLGHGLMLTNGVSKPKNGLAYLASFGRRSERPSRKLAIVCASFLPALMAAAAARHT
jgi:hypothetical protein